MILKRRWRCSGMINSQICVPITHNSAVIVVYDDRSEIHKSHNRLVPKYVNMLLQRYAFDNFVWKKKPNKILALLRELYGSYTVSFSMLPRWAETQKYTHTHTWMLETYILYTANFDTSFGMNSCQNGWFFMSFSVAVWAFCLVHGIQRTVCMYKGYRYEFHTMKRRKISSI